MKGSWMLTQPHTTMLRLISIALCFASSSITYAQNSQAMVDERGEPVKVMAGVIVTDTTDSLISVTKTEAGLNLALQLAGCGYIPTFARDSALQNTDQKETTIIDASRAFGCNYIVFASMRRFMRLIRAEVQVVRSELNATPRRAVGYAPIVYARTDSDLVSDPAVLLSLQRALITALPTSPRYDTLAAGLRALPAELISVSGIVFRTDSSLAPWQLFHEKMLSSYDAAQTIVGLMQRVDTLAVVDIETRDAMFAKAGFALVENDRAMSDIEMRILRAFDIGLVIQGSFVRIAEGARLHLEVVRLHGAGDYSVLQTAQETITSDSKEAFRLAVTACTRKLFGLPPSAR